jgi:chromosome segregation ATPase
MFDSLRGLGAKKTHSDAAELLGVIEAAREERRALGALLTELSTRGAQLAQLGTSLEGVDQRISGATARLAEVSQRIEGLEVRAHALDDVERRVTALAAAATHAHELTGKILASDGDLQAQRRQLSDLSLQTLETQASLEALSQDRAALDGLRQELRRTQAEIQRSADGAGSVRGELERIHGMTRQLSTEYDTLHDGLRSAREDSRASPPRKSCIRSRRLPSRSRRRSRRSKGGRTRSTMPFSKPIA